MGYDIGPRIGIKGEKEFNAQIDGINQNLKVLGSELKAVSTEFDDNASSQQALIAKNKVMNQQLDVQKQKFGLIQEQIEKETKKLDELKNILDKTTKEFGENSAEVQKAQLEYKKQADNINKLKVGANETRSFINKLSKEIDKNEDALKDMRDGTRDATTGLKKLSDESKDAADNMDDLGDAAKDTGEAFAGAFAGGAIAEQIQAIGSALKDVAEESKEHLKIMGALETSSGLAGYSAEETAETYMQLYGILGDDQTTATTTANLQALQLSQKDLKLMVEGTIGAWAQYGDSIPIDGLAESINETVKVGQVTGTFADVLNWAGTSEDEFNEKLEKCSSESERVNLVLEEMTKQGLTDSAAKFRENNEALVENNEAQGKWQDTLSELGEKSLPVLTKITEALDFLLNVFLELPEPIQILVGVTLALTVAFAALSPAVIALKIAVDGFNMSILPIVGIIAGVIIAITAIILIVQNWGEITEWFSQKWDEFCEWFGQICDDVCLWFREKWQALGDWWNELCENISTWFKEKWDSLKQWFFDIIDGITSFFSEKWDSMVQHVKDIFQRFADNVKSILDDIQQVFDGIIKFITGIFTGNWEQAWGGIVDIFDGIIRGIVDIFKAPFNWIIDGINDFIKAANDISIPDWVPGIGGLSLDLPLIPRLKVGMDFVPSDYYPAFLDYGEAVLTKEQNKKFRDMGGIEGMERMYKNNQAIMNSAYMVMPSMNITVDNYMKIDGKVVAKSTNRINTREQSNRMRMKGART